MIVIMITGLHKLFCYTLTTTSITATLATAAGTTTVVHFYHYQPQISLALLLLLPLLFTNTRCLVGLVVKASALGVEDLGFKSHLRWDFSRSSHTSDLKVGTPVATLPGAWHYSVSTGTGWPSVSVLRLGEVESLICNFYLSVAAHKIVPEIHQHVAGTLSNQPTNN